MEPITLMFVDFALPSPSPNASHVAGAPCDRYGPGCAESGMLSHGWRHHSYVMTLAVSIAVAIVYAALFPQDVQATIQATDANAIGDDPGDLQAAAISWAKLESCLNSGAVFLPSVDSAPDANGFLHSSSSTSYVFVELNFVDHAGGSLREQSFIPALQPTSTMLFMANVFTVNFFPILIFLTRYKTMKLLDNAKCVDGLLAMVLDVVKYVQHSFVRDALGKDVFVYEDPLLRFAEPRDRCHQEQVHQSSVVK